jgi:hypothetical protein
VILDPAKVARRDPIAAEIRSARRPKDSVVKRVAEHFHPIKIFLNEASPPGGENALLDQPSTLPQKRGGQPDGFPAIVKGHFASDVIFAERQGPVGTRAVFGRVPPGVEQEFGAPLKRESSTERILEELVSQSMHQADDDAIFPQREHVL